MNNSKSFIFAWALTTAILTANVFIRANEGQTKAQQDTVSSSSTVLVDGCSVGATLALLEKEVKAVMVVTNPTDAAITIELNYQVQCIPTMSPFARMLPLPKTRESGSCRLTLEAGKSVEKTFTVAPENELEDLSTSGSWSFVVSREEIETPMLGAGAPVVTMNHTSLTKGPAVLARLQLTRPLANTLLISTP